MTTVAEVIGVSRSNLMERMRARPKKRIGRHPRPDGKLVERVRVAFALDCCDREAMSFLATTSGVSGEDVRDLMLAAVEHRFGSVNRLPVTIEWLSDNGGCYLAGKTRSFAR